MVAGAEAAGDNVGVESEDLAAAPTVT